MQTYISILRGINVSGHNIIKMADLKSQLSACGLDNVETYIQSGNIIYQYKKGSAQLLDKIIKEKISQEFNFEVPVITLSSEELIQIQSNNPFLNHKGYDSAYIHVTFLSDLPSEENSGKLSAINYLPDEFALVGKSVYLYCPKGYGNTKLSNKFLESRLKVTATTRNWRTINELISITEKLNKKL